MSRHHNNGVVILPVILLSSCQQLYGAGVTLLREHDVRIFRDAGKQSLVGGSYELDIELFLNRKQCGNRIFDTYFGWPHPHDKNRCLGVAAIGIGASDTGHPRPITLQITLSVSWNKF